MKCFTIVNNAENTPGDSQQINTVLSLQVHHLYSYQHSSIPHFFNPPSLSPPVGSIITFSYKPTFCFPSSFSSNVSHTRSRNCYSHSYCPRSVHPPAPRTAPTLTPHSQLRPRKRHPKHNRRHRRHQRASRNPRRRLHRNTPRRRQRVRQSPYQPTNPLCAKSGN